jgi:phage baseplate assembly protein W
VSLVPDISSFRGMDNQAGGAVVGLDWLRQAIRDVLTTPIGSRVMRRTYGSVLFELVDAPMNRATIADIVAGAALALATWLPMILVKTIQVIGLTPGAFDIDLGFILNGQLVTMTGVLS